MDPGFFKGGEVAHARTSNENLDQIGAGSAYGKKVNYELIIIIGIHTTYGLLVECL